MQDDSNCVRAVERKDGGVPGQRLYSPGVQCSSELESKMEKETRVKNKNWCERRLLLRLML